MLGYHQGRQAPGRQDFGAAMHSVHHLLLGHGLATQRMREADPEADFCITLNMSQHEPATDSEADREAARREDGLTVRVYLDPLVHGRYPEDVVADLAARDVVLPVQDGDLEIISTPIDTLGVNYYFASLTSGVDLDGSTVDSDGIPVGREVRLGRPVTEMDWEIVPEGFTSLLVRLARDYPGLPMVITENGSAWADEPDEEGFVKDNDRTEYFADHIGAVSAAVRAGADIRGYFAWSLMDNLEWSYGYAKRFGLVHVDFDTLVRTPKASAHWYRDTIRRAKAAPE
jgi:beta-glucosidase